METRNCIAIGILLLIAVFVFAAGRRDAINTIKRSAISCGSAKTASEHTSRSKNDNSGNGCTHQTVNAALPGRVKRGRIHGC